MDADEIRHKAMNELYEEAVRARVEAKKLQLRQQRSWKTRLANLFPFTITIQRKPK